MTGPFISETFNRADAARNAALREDVNDHISALGDAFEVVRSETAKESADEIDRLRARIEALEGALRQAANHLALASDDFLDVSERHGRATVSRALKRRSSICAAAAEEARAAAKEALDG